MLNYLKKKFFFMFLKDAMFTKAAFNWSKYIKNDNTEKYYHNIKSNLYFNIFNM